MDILEKKLAEKQYVAIRKWFFITIKFLRNLFFMWAIVNAINSIWMHLSFEIHGYIIDEYIRNFENNEPYIKNYFDIWMG